MQTITSDEVRTVRHLQLRSREQFLDFLREHDLMRAPHFMVTGSRSGEDADLVRRVLDGIPAKSVMLEGEANGPDRIARRLWLDRGGVVAGSPPCGTPGAARPGRCATS